MYEGCGWIFGMTGSKPRLGRHNGTEVNEEKRQEEPKARMSHADRSNATVPACAKSWLAQTSE